MIMPNDILCEPNCHYICIGKEKFSTSYFSNAIQKMKYYPKSNRLIAWFSTTEEGYWDVNTLRALLCVILNNTEREECELPEFVFRIVHPPLLSITRVIE